MHRAAGAGLVPVQPRIWWHSVARGARSTPAIRIFARGIVVRGQTLNQRVAGSVLGMRHGARSISASAGYPPTGIASRLIGTAIGHCPNAVRKDQRTGAVSTG